MKANRFIQLTLAAAFLAVSAPAGETVTNRLSASLRFGLNIKARFKGSATLPLVSSGRTTPNGDAYNYDDGYVLTDISGNEGGQTWYWGYDNGATHPAGQISDGVAFPANTILMSRSTPDANFTSPSMDEDPHLGAEIVYDRHFVTSQNINYGIEVAANYLNISFRDSRSYSGSAMRTTDAYPYTPGTTPPGATPNDPYQGSYEGFGFLLGDAPVSSSTTTVAGGYNITGSRQLDADLWGGRLGPYMDYPISETMNLWISGGLSLGIVNANASWNETVSIGANSSTSVGSGSNRDVLWGWFVSANFSWDVSEHWSALAGVQYQDLGKYSHNFGARTVELDLSKSIFITLGISYRF